MNWFTKGFIIGQSLEHKQALVDQDGACEHVLKDISLAQHIRRENDSYGIVGQFVLCEACDKAEVEREENESVICHDCSSVVLRKNSIQWRWYDFYAPQGDIAITVCYACRTKEKHKDRVAQDERDYRAEFPQHFEEPFVDFDDGPDSGYPDDPEDAGFDPEEDNRG